MTYTAHAGYGPEFALAAARTMTEIFEEVLGERGAEKASGDDKATEDEAEGRGDGN